MKKEDLYDAITEVSDEHLRRADACHEQRKGVARRRWRRAAVAAVLVIAVLGGVVIHSFTGNGGVVGPTAYAVALAEYPEMAVYPSEEESNDWTQWNKAYNAWREDIEALGRNGYAEGLDEFFAASTREFLVDAGGENKVYSPLNVYMALAMLAELTDGNSRRQILDLLRQDGIEDLRAQANDLWCANYRDDGLVTRVLASSVWLDEDIEYVQETMDTLAETYYASSYRGQMGSDGYNKALQDWLNEQTGGLLEEQAGQIELSPDTVLALATTIYFQAQWSQKFSAAQTAEDVFYTETDEVTVDFMNKRYSGGYSYYWGNSFSGVYQRLDSGLMWFILPDEGVSVDELLRDEQVTDFIMAGTDWEQSQQVVLNLSVPKFDVTSQIDLRKGLKVLGITDVFDGAISDFTPMTAQYDEIYVSQAKHDARVAIDEKGATATAFTVLVTENTSAAIPPEEEVEFVLNRPFLFTITGDDGLPLFVGVVNNP